MKNIKIAYILSYLSMSSFWGGIWVLYYLSFTNYAGIGLIESIMIITSVTTEIHTGAVADLLGKKKTLVFSFLLLALGSFIMGTAINFISLLISVILMSTGRSLYSGTMEALVYDSLKEKKKENNYDRIIANITTIQLVAFALSTIIGGFMYSINPGFPFIAVGIIHIIGLFITFLLKEPRIDTIRFSFNNFLKQTKLCFHQLFSNEEIKKQTIILLSIGIFLVIIYEVLNDVLAFEFGFKEKQLGVLISTIYLISAGASQISPKITKRFGYTISLFLVSLLVGISLVVSPIIGMILGGFTIMLRSGLQSIFNNISSTLINKSVESRYRATTLSTFSMLQKIPYALSAFVIGGLMDLWSAKIFAFFLGIILVALITIQIKNSSFQKK